jgi:hypothetical protein
MMMIEVGIIIFAAYAKEQTSITASVSEPIEITMKILCASFELV